MISNMLPAPVRRLRVLFFMVFPGGFKSLARPGGVAQALHLDQGRPGKAVYSIHSMVFRGHASSKIMSANHPKESQKHKEHD